MISSTFTNLTLSQNQNENPESQHYVVATEAMLWYPFEQNPGCDQYLEHHGSCLLCSDYPVVQKILKF